MEESLNLNGKKFISAKKAAEITGYTSDYVGQLCRGGKIDAKLVGRSWHVSEKDILDHKNDRHINFKNLKSKLSTSSIKKTKRKQQKITSSKKNKRNSLNVSDEDSAFDNQKIPTNKSFNSTNEKSRLSEINTDNILYSKDEKELFPKIVKQNDVNTIKFVTLNNLKKSAGTPQKMPIFEKFVIKTSLVLLAILFVGTLIYEKDSIVKLEPTNLWGNVKKEISFLYSPYFNNSKSENIAGINSNENQLASLFSINDNYRIVSGWLKDTAYKIVKPWLEKELDKSQIVVNEKNDENNQIVIINKKITEPTQAKTVYINNSTNTSDKDYIDFKIAELKNYFLLNPLAPNVNRYYLSRQNDVIVSRISSSGSSSSSGSGGASILSDLSDLTLSSVVYGDLLMYNGSEWVNTATSSLGIIGAGDFAWPFSLQSWGVSTSTTIGLLNGFLSTASSTIVGNATTTGSMGVGALFVNGDYITDFTGTNLSITNGVLSASGSGGGSGNVSTSSIPTIGQVSYWTTSGENTELLGSIATGTISVPTGLTSTANRYVLGGNLSIAFDTDYFIPTSTRASTWDTAYSWGDWSGQKGFITDGNTNWDNSYGFITGSYSGFIETGTTSVSSITTLPNLSLPAGQVTGLSYYTDSDTNSYIHASTTIPKTYTNNTFSGTNIFSNTLTAQAGLTLSNIAINSILSTDASGNISATSTPTFGAFNATSTTATSTITGGLDITKGLNLNNGYIYGAGLSSCSGSSDKLIYNASTGKFGCGADAGAGGGITAIGAQYSSYQTGASQTFATSTSGNLTLSITSSGDTHTFTPGLASGYVIPLSASTTEWNNFYTTPSNRITAGLNLAWNGNTLNLSTTTLNLTTSSFASNNISQWNNDSSFITSIVADAPLNGIGTAANHLRWTGLATTSQPASSNILVSNGSAGVYGVATSTLTASAPLTGSFVQIGSGGSLGCTTASGSAAGCLSSANWNTFNNKIGTSTTPTLGQLSYWGGTATVPALSSVATSTISAGTGVTFSATPGYLVGGSNFTISTYAWPFTASTNYVSTSTTLGLLNGFFSTASSTISGTFNLPSLSQGFAYTGTGGRVNTIASSSVQLSWFNNDSGYLTSATGLTSYDAFTHPAAGQSATTSLMMLNGNASTIKADNAADWFYPAWAVKAKFNQPINVLDTDSALGRYSLKTKEIGLKDLVRMHGHLCDGMVIAFIETRAVLNKLFPNGVVDRTDLVAVSKNGPCWVDTVALMTGTRINFQTMRIDNTIGDGFILQRVSTAEAYDVHLKPGVFPKDQAELEAKIRKLRSEGKPVTAEEINQVEKMADDLSHKLLNTPQEDILDIKLLTGYKFRAMDLFGNRGDIINKSMPR